MPHLEVNGQRLHVQDTGGEGPPVVFSHGFLLDHRMFAPQVEALRTTRRVITWDARGSGETRSDGEPFTYWDTARDLLGMLDQLGIERAALVGTSQGGSLSLRAALLAPDRVRALVLMATAPAPETPEAAAAYRALLDGWATDGSREETADAAARMILGGEMCAREWRPIWRGWPAHRLTESGRALLTREDVTDRLPEIDAPTLVIHGGEDVAIPLTTAEATCATLPECRGLVVVDGAAQAPNLTHPAVVNPALRDFLDGLPA